MRKYSVLCDKLTDTHVIEADHVEFNSGNIVFYDEGNNVVAVYPNGTVVFPAS